MEMRDEEATFNIRYNMYTSTRNPDRTRVLRSFSLDTSTLEYYC